MNRCAGWVLMLSMVITARGASTDPVVPVVPTVFFLSREARPYRAPKSETPTMANVQAIVSAARKILKVDTSEYFENVIILDEGDCWFVSFHARGNGNVKFPKLTPDLVTTDATGYFMTNPNAGVYLDKKDLTKAKRGPENPIRSLPLISPMGEQVRGLGLVVEPGETQPKH